MTRPVTHSANTAFLDDALQEFAAIDAREARQPKASHVCGVCGQQAYRTSLDGGVAIYRCEVCGLPTVVDASPWRGFDGK